MTNRYMGYVEVHFAYCEINKNINKYKPCSANRCSNRK